ncbi:MAG: protein kinase [Kiritimatiellae bacterium]|nr:protein kinase [Kiritimatiellia bacterium]
MEIKPKKSTVKIDLTAEHNLDNQRNLSHSTLRTDVTLPQNEGMTLNNLKNNYKTIIQSNGIFYPVAFQFKRELGRGRQGRVFLGLRQGARGCITEHAIKIYDPELYHSAEEYWTDMGRIASQISQLQQIQSPNLVSRHSYDETYGVGYVQMEAINGIDLGTLLSRDSIELAKEKCTTKEWKEFTKSIFYVAPSGNISLQPAFVVYIMRNVLRGLERLHEFHFIHSDLKPGNIMVDRLGSIKIVDFGRAVIDGENLTFLFGSPMYMPPELHKREVAGPAADLFGVGLVALELLRGEPLTDDVNTSEQELLEIKLTLAENLEKILPKNVLRDKDLIQMLKKVLDPVPENRYKSAKAAEAGQDGLVQVNKRLTKLGINTEFERIISAYLSKLVDAKTSRIEITIPED